MNANEQAHGMSEPESGEANLSPERIRELGESEELSPDQLGELLDEGFSLEQLRAVDELRTPVVKALARRDIEEHRDIYDRLAES